MRLHLRLRTILIFIALTAMLLAYAAAIWNGEGFAFQHRHAALADGVDAEAEWDRQFLSTARAHVASGHVCGECSGCIETLPIRFAERTKRLDRLERQIRWHRFWAGPLLERRSTISVKVGHGYGPCGW